MANLLETSNITRLTQAVLAGREYRLRDEYTWYAGQRQASPHKTHFQLWWVDFKDHSKGKVEGEVGFDWSEVHEVGRHFNSDHDGLFYYVGGVLLPDTLRPSYEEAKFYAPFLRDERDMTYTDRLMYHLLFWGMPSV